MNQIYSLYKEEKSIIGFSHKRHRIRIVATIGIFDGVHKGHQKILKKLLNVSFMKKAKSIVVTFYPHPRTVLNKSKIPLLVSLNHRIKLIKEMGVDYCHIIKFTRQFSKLGPEDFIKKVFIERMDLAALIVGENFFFGFKERGNCSFLRRLSKKYGFGLYCIKPLKIKKEIISSTRIRQVIERGDLKKASWMLNRPVSILGTVVKGKKIGRKLGFPTANINPHHEAIPASGVYAVDVKIGTQTHKAILNIGTRPTFGADKEPTIEVYIFNFKRNIYGLDIEVIFKRKIREEEKFVSIEALKTRIKKDILEAQ